MVSLVGETQNFDGNGGYVRIGAGGATGPVQTPSVGPGGPLHASAPRAAARHAAGEGRRARPTSRT